MKNKIFYVIGISVLITGCATMTLSEQALGVKLPVYQQDQHADSAKIIFSSDKKYESKKGLPFKGEPIVCTDQGLSTTFIEKGKEINPIFVPAGEEVILTSVIKWHNSGWEKTCWPFIKFVPESGASYAVVNERIGGKGVSAIWTGVAFQSCEISVYKINSEKVEKIQIESADPQSCKGKTHNEQG